MKTIVVGFDSFDPDTFERLQTAGQMPNLEKFSREGGYSRLEVCSPPQTEVSWTSIATGVDPGSHGIFDFVHRDPKTYGPYVSLLPTKQGALGEQFLPPYTTQTLFHEASAMGFPSVVSSTGPTRSSPSTSTLTQIPTRLPSERDAPAVG